MELLEKRKQREMTGGEDGSPVRQSTPDRGNANPMY